MSTSFFNGALALHDKMQALEDELDAISEAALVSLDRPIGDSNDYAVPFLYLARHGLELLLKTMCWCWFAHGGSQMPKKGHGLETLWAPASAFLESVLQWQDEGGALQALVTFFHTIDKSGMELRYPDDRSGSNFSSAVREADQGALAEPRHNLSQVARCIRIAMLNVHVVDEMEFRADAQREMEIYLAEP